MEMAMAAGVPGTSMFKRQLSQLVFKDSGLLIRLATTAILGALLALAVPYGARIALDRALPDASPNLLMVVVLCGVVVVAHQAWFSWVQESTRIVLSAAVEKKALAGVLNALMRADLAQLQKRNSGWMTTTLNGASSTVETYVNSFVVMLTQGLFAIGYLVVLANASTSMAVLLVAFNLAVTAMSYVIAKFESSNIRQMLERRSIQQELLNVLLTVLPSIRGHFATDRLSAHWGERVNETGHSSLQVARVGALMSMVKSTGNQLFGVGFMIWAVYGCLNGELSIGEMMFLLSVSTGLTNSLVALIGVWTGLRALTPHFGRVDEVLRSAASSRKSKQKFTPSGDTIVIDKVFFRYSTEDRWVIQGQSTEFKKGEVHRISSPSGSGKSTLLRIIAGLHAPTSGKVRVFGVNSSETKELVLYVPQHCKLFETSIRENLELLSGASMERLAEVAELTGFSRVLQKLPMGLETLVSAEGQNISSGQRQLLILTAAFATDRPVILLDEATSQVDEAARKRCRWDKLLAGRTVLIVEHG